ncbi:hypothetical protein J3Q64DRAFT_1657273 [Phycomyces blakesleeanus]|uniref:Uncharacterized protein n=2 Tax=Phycomyces blakesleeanus TaxID=4837 RepID=A0A162U900_PHYB8|nr:hypothetical protein PHYBLDRAFT_181227 [Phycomyces blakesleeanus NRRL 1555(-)]KAI9027301.1 hypothetical protein CLU79DRAFT_885623 [Phycomyces nitens]OAD74442.1 hypothetical protein PHYBLDRAFT_181227 [Phycomyces blakesleeanus NRRL 1555(-)]|eukprot:XP_018292482.1 hypothetical protein PHYBLDRAFT_181227 [Phycomyces blakesleeanus NRRL 1555(-)]
MATESKGGLSDYVSTKIYQYELQTALYMLEPWEKALFNTLLLSIVSLSAVTLYQYTPLVFNKLMT